MSFLSPLFLLGLAAVALPIIVHLVRRTRAKKIEFPSLMFVRQIPQRTIRRRRLINWLLLALRCLALLCLVLAFARPFFTSSNAAESLTRAKAKIILLDTSLSLRYGKRFEQALTQARTIVNESGTNDQLALITFGNGYEILNRFTNEKNKINSLLDQAKAGLNSTAYAQALRGAEELMKETTVADKQIFLITDFQAAGWNQSETAFRLNNQIKLITKDVGASDSPNLAVTDLNAQAVVYQPKYTDKLAARITNFSDDARDSLSVELQLNDHPIEKRQVKVPARESATVEFTDFNLNEGVNRAVIVINDNNFDADDKFYFTLHREAQAQALIIEAAGRAGNESLYLRNALTTGENLPFTWTVKTPASVNSADLPNHKVIILNDVESITNAFAENLKSFVEKGGGLVIATARHADTASFNDAFKNIAPSVLGEAVQLTGNYSTLSNIKTDHPVFEVFRNSGRLAAARVFGYRRSEPKEKAAVLARFEDGSPALTEISLGQGKVLMFTSSLDASWNDLPLTPLYLPLVRQMTKHLGEKDRQAWQTIGNTFTVSSGQNGEAPSIDSPSNNRLTDRTATNAGQLIVKAQENGFYRVRSGSDSDFVAVNVDGKESDLSRLNVDDFTAAISGGEAQATQAPGAQVKFTNEERESKQRTWWMLLIAASLLFLAEAVISRRTKIARMIG